MMNATLTADQIALAAHLAAMNAKTAAWVAQDPQNRWASGLVEDLAHWAQYGISSPAQLDHYLLVTEVYELTRAVIGFKPHWGSINASSDEDLQQELASLKFQAQRQIEYEQDETKAEEEAIAKAMDHKSGFAIGELVNL